MFIPKIHPIPLTEYISQEPSGGFYFFSPHVGFFCLQAENSEKVRLNIYNSDLKILSSYELLPSLWPQNLFALCLKDLPDSFAYSWQVNRLGKWSEPFADPLHPWLAGHHHWKKEASSNLSWVDAREMTIGQRFLPQKTTQPRPHLPASRLRIYECHVKAATMQLMSLQPQRRGTLEALPYLLDHVEALGCNAIELLPLQTFNELNCPFKDPVSKKPLVNFWGYMPHHLMALMRAYSEEGTSLGAEKALGFFIDQAHQRGIEVILDVVFNHVDLQDDQSLWQCFPMNGFFRSAPYTSIEELENKDFLVDYSGCGNTPNFQNPTIGSHMIHILRQWARRFSFDGFRFDLGGAFSRMENGSCNPKSPFLQQLAQDPFLKGLKLIFEPWDAKGAWLVGKLAPHGFYEWNDRFRDDMKRFINFGENKDLAATRLSGSSDLYEEMKRPSGIHYLTCHDGFTLLDQVSYQDRHNEANGELGKDGHHNNLSRNHGVEGPTDDPKILHLREKQLRNHLLALTISHGPIMMLSGDEYGHTRKGNNNPWCQDNELNAFDWERLHQSDLLDYWKRLLKWRATFNLIESDTFYDEHCCKWLSADNTPIDWQKEKGVLIFELQGDASRAFVAFNSREEPLSLTLPDSDEPWKLIVTSSSYPTENEPKSTFILESWSSALFETRC